jgi:hypothetical protein
MSLQALNLPPKFRLNPQMLIFTLKCFAMPLINTHVLRISLFLKAQGFAPYESPSVMRIRESNKLVRTVAIHRYVTDGQEAVLAYGEEVSGLVWAYAIVIPNNGQRYALRVGSSGQIERFEAHMINQVDWDC